MKAKSCLLLAVFMPLLVLCVTCSNPSSDPEIDESDLAEQETVFEFSAGKQRILAISNMSRKNTEISFQFSRSKSARNMNSTVLSLDSVQNKETASPAGRILQDVPRIARRNANPPPFSPASGRRLSSAVNPSYKVDASTYYFWVWEKNNKYEQKNTTLRAMNDRCLVWVVNDYFNNGSAQNNDGYITSAQAKELADRFAAIYPLATSLLGYEYGGGPGGDGGIDGDTRIQILVHDIDGDWAPNQFGSGESDPGGVVGLYDYKDEFSQATLNNWAKEEAGWKGVQSNTAEIFYIDAHACDYLPDFTHSSLIHEFQHMINFNRKLLEKDVLSDSWYNEMLSMLAEDVIGPQVGINQDNPGHPVNERVPALLDYYHYPIDQWDNDNAVSYSVVYGFGAYLVRNYGGPQLIRDMMANNKVDHDSITQALKKYDSDLNFKKALERYAEALVYSRSHGGISGKKTLDKTASSGAYKAEAFDIWNINAYPTTGRKGPILGSPLKLDAPYVATAPGSSVVLVEIPDSWKGTVYLLVSPKNTDVRLTILEY